MYSLHTRIRISYLTVSIDRDSYVEFEKCCVVVFWSENCLQNLWCVCVCHCDCVREDSVTLLICLAEKLILLLALFTFIYLFWLKLSGTSLFEPVMTLSLHLDNRGKGHCTLWAQMSWWNFKKFICISKLNWYWYIWKNIKVEQS